MKEAIADIFRFGRFRINIFKRSNEDGVYFGFEIIDASERSIYNSFESNFEYSSQEEAKQAAMNKITDDILK